MDIKYSKNIILVIVLVFISIISMPTKAKIQVCQSFKPFKMVFLPDTHVSFKDEDSWILYKESLVIFQDTIKNLKTIPNLNFVVFGGDLIDNDDNTLSDLPLFLDSLEDTSFNYYTILGDREADLKYSYSKQDFCSEFRRNGFSNPNLTYWSELPTENILLIGLDTSIENGFEGKIPKEELLWLDETLKSNPDRFIIITMHHSPVQWTTSDKTIREKADCEQRLKGRLARPVTPFMASNQVENSDEFLNLINKYPQVKLVLSGHHHNYAVKRLNGKLFMSIPSIVTYPNSYKVLTVYPDRVEVENKDITFKQIIKKSKNIIVKTQYASDFDSKNPKKVLDFQNGGKISRQKVFYYQE